MVKLEFHDPSGTIEVTQPHAPRLASFEGKRIGFVSNEQWQAYRMLPMLKEMIEASRSNDVRVFYELPETGGVFGAIQQNAAALFLGEMSPEDFSAKVQEAVIPSGP